ncbi:hypothetical protein [Nocardiopsis algeriensis]|uniref:LPXTG-motif cell wall-anchored protein n=1 Tax=Nocardiopsis algeriensis TaxID=1478215 RepID=A0A841IRN6_9ACTN|nr:hypothetical protein [Nocardiopsis algeriensis]MBB6120870.1 hypothetical protein [Nocardiopsis algeriensis]
MARLILVLLAIWLVLTVAGILIEGLFWLAVVGGGLFLATVIWSRFRNR